eukprot:UN14467
MQNNVYGKIGQEEVCIPTRMGIDNWNIEWVHSPDMRGCQCYGLDWFVSCTRIML